MRPKKELQAEAKRLRRDGASIKEIARNLGVAKSSVSLWARDVQLSVDQRIELHNRRRQFGDENKGAQTNQERFQDQRKAYQQAGREQAKQGSKLHMAGCMLYWAEGTKDRNRLEFVNSDVQMMRFFIRFLREELDVLNTSIKVNIHCHTQDTDEQKSIQEFWLTELNLPGTSLGNTYFKVGSNSRNNRLTNGICGIRVESTELVQQIYGAIQEYGGFDKPDWLF